MQHQPQPGISQRRNTLAAREANRQPRLPVTWTLRGNVAAVILAVIAVGIILRLADDILIPVVAAIMTALMLGPISDVLCRARVPAVVVALGLVLMLILLLAIIPAAVSAPIASWIERAPEIGETLRQRLAFLIEPLAAAERLQEMVKSVVGGAKGALSVEVATPGVGASLVTTVSPALGQLLVFFGVLFFMLLGRERLKGEIVLAFRGRKRRLAVLHTITGIQQDLGVYLGTVAVINLCLGIVVGIGMAIIGMPNPFLWALLTFALNFVPFLGTAIMAGLTTIGGLVTFEPLTLGLMPLAIYLGTHLIESQLITPTLLGSRFAVNPLFVFLSIVFWTWLWGPAGALLSTPILVTATSIWAAFNAEKLPSLPR
jgi:predicted PurR-regulated permease PerM